MHFCVSIIVPIAHEGRSLGWRACQMALYVKVSSSSSALISSGHFTVTGWTLTSVIPLGEQPAVSLPVLGQLNHAARQTLWPFAPGYASVHTFKPAQLSPFHYVLIRCRLLCEVGLII